MSMDKLLLPMAYKYVVLMVMLGEINHCTDKLGLPGPAIRQDDVSTFYVTHPLLTGFGGTVETENFSFSFFKSGILRQIVRIHKFDRSPRREVLLNLSRLSSVIGTNDAYRLATNWLHAIDVNAFALERRYGHHVEQTFFYGDRERPSSSGRRVVLLPIFHVTWGNERDPAVTVSIYGPTRELLAIRQSDDSFSQRPRNLLTNVSDLLNISDAEFVSYSAIERDRLVQRFATTHLTATNARP